MRVTSLERTLGDVLDRPELGGGGWEEIWRSLETVKSFGLDGVVECALLLDKAVTGAKAGLFLEQHKEPVMVENAHLESLHGHRPRQRHYPARNRRGGRLRRLDLVLPAEIHERSWQAGT